MYQRHGSTEYDPEHYVGIPNEADDARVIWPNTIQNPFREYKATKLQCRMRCRLSLGDLHIDRCYYKNQQRIEPDNELIWNRKTTYEITCRQSNDIQKERDNRTGIQNPYRQS